MKKPTVHVYLLAYNEEENVADVVTAVFQQKISGFTFTGVTVYTDGSTDDTVKVVKKLQATYKRLYLKKYNSNRGKLFRLNQVFRENTAEIAVILDCDIALVGNKFIETLCRPFFTNKNIMLAAADSQMILPKSVIGKIVASPFLTWDYIRLSIPHYDSVHNFSSQATAYRGSFTKKLHIPSTALEERIYLYLMAKKENKKGFLYVRSAKVKFMPPSSLTDLLLMTKRPFGRKQNEVNELFGFDTEKLLTISKKYKLEGMRQAFFHHPFLTPTGLLLNFIIPKLSTIYATNASAKWERSNSTKGRIQI